MFRDISYSLTWIFLELGLMLGDISYSLTCCYGVVEQLRPLVKTGTTETWDWRLGPHQGAGPLRDLLGPKGLEGHPRCAAGITSRTLWRNICSAWQSWTEERGRNICWTNKTIRLDPPSCLLPLCFIDRYNRKSVSYIFVHVSYTINTRTKTIEPADITNHKQVCTYL